MPEIRWVGVIRDPDVYESGRLPENAVKMKMPESIQTAALPFMVLPALLCIGSVVLKSYFSRQNTVHPLWLFAGVAIGFLLFPLHEFLHAVVYPRGAQVFLGVVPKQLCAVALASYPLRRKRFLLMCVLPVILGLIPLLLFWTAPAADPARNSLFFGAAVLGMVSPYPDFYNAYQALKQAPKQAYIQFEHGDTYYFEAADRAE